MDKGKLKNIIILVLAAVNVFFAAMCILNAAEKRTYDRQAGRSMQEALSANGIKVENSALLQMDAIPACTFERSLSEEGRRISAIIGSTSSENLGGNIIMYTGKSGQACFRGTGDFEILMENGAVEAENGPVTATEFVMKKLGLGIDEESAETNDGGDANACQVTALCSYKDRPIVNCRVDFTYSNGRLLLATGSMPLTDIKESRDSQILDISTVIMRFLDILNNKGYACSRIDDIGHCYRMEAGAAGTGTLTPIWHFSTDIGDFYINGVTGREETVTQSN